MRLVFGLVLIVGVGLAGFAVYMAQSYVSAYRLAEDAARAENVPMKPIFIANRDLNYGDKIGDDDIIFARWPEKFIPEGAFRGEEDWFSKGPENQRTALRPIQKFEPLLAAKVTEPGEDAGITSRLKKGMRAFAIRVDVTSGVSGFLRPGDYVDVYWSGRTLDGDESEGDITKLIQSRVHLIAVDQTSDSNLNRATIARTVTVEVTPTQVAALAQAQATGSLTLALVGASDDTVTQQVEIDQRVLLGIEREAVIEAEVEESCTIRTRRGAEVVEIPIPCTN